MPSKKFAKINKYFLFFNLFFLESYLLRSAFLPDKLEQLLPLPFNLQEILFLIQAIFFLIYIIKEKKFLLTIKNLRHHHVILGLIFLTIFSVLLITPSVVEDIDIYFIRHLKFLFFSILINIIFLETFVGEEERKKIISIAGTGALVFGLFSVIYNLLGYNVAADFRLLGPLDAAVYLAFYLTPFFLFFTFQFIENPAPKKNLFLAIGLFILILGTRSMGSIVGSFLIIVLFLLKTKGKKLFDTKTKKITLALLIIAIFSTAFYVKILPAFSTKYTSLGERGEIWETSIELLKEPKNLIFGLGIGQFQSTYEKNVTEIIGRQPLDFYVLQPHNIFLLFIFQFGILGLIFIIYILWKLIKFLIKTKETISPELVFGFIALYFFLHGMIDTPFFKNDLLILFILFLELGLSKTSLKPRNQVQ